MSENNNEIVRPYKGMDMDSSPLDMSKDNYRFALNAVVETDSGDQNFLTNEGSNVSTGNLRVGSVILGDRYISDDTTLIISTNLNTGRDYIGILHKDGQYDDIVETESLNLQPEHQIDIIYRLRRGNQRIIYWVDGYNNPRQFNLDRKEQYYTTAYTIYLAGGGDPDTYVGEKWDVSAFDLIKGYTSIPRFESVEVLEYGSITPGSYNFAIQYLDENLNPTEWVNVSNTVNIFNDSVDKPYQRIRGSRNTQSDSQNYVAASKSIKLTITNLDENFPFYRVAIIQATSNNGKVTKALSSPALSVQSSTYIYSGNDEQLTEVPLQDILLEGEKIIAPKHIEQIENRLLLANSKSAQYDWCTFQQFASKISSDLVTKEVVLNSTLSTPNQKNPNSTFMYRGYMPGEVYSFGIVYLMKDGTISPVCHIPGRNSAVVTAMDYHELDTNYISLHSCYGQNQYWGQDSASENLTGTKIRHHKFPTRKTANKPLITSTDDVVDVTRYKLRFKMSLAPGKTWPTDTLGAYKTIAYTVFYKPDYSTTPISYSGYLNYTDLEAWITVYDDIYTPEIVTTDYLEFDPNCELVLSYQPSGDETFTYVQDNNSYVQTSITGATTSEIFGIQFSNITKPHPDVIGCYIVRNERTDDDRIIADNAIIGLNVEYNQYAAFTSWMTSASSTKWSSFNAYFFSPEHQFFKKKLPFKEMEIQGRFVSGQKSFGPKSFSSTGVNLEGSSNPNVAAAGIRGVLIQDVYPGTSYNAEIHTKKSKDNDGFSLAVGYRDNLLYYELGDLEDYGSFYLDEAIYLDACSYKLDGETVYYNTSCDNKIGIAKTLAIIDSDLFYKNIDEYPFSTRCVGYAALINDNKSSYADFINRPYYKEHNNPFLFAEDTDKLDPIDIYNGDSFISPMNLTTSMFWEQRISDRDKKNRTWAIVAGAILAVVGVVVAVFTAGAGLAISAAGLAIAGLAIAYGVSTIMSGIKFEQMKNMIDNDYPKGLQDCIKERDNMYILNGVEDYDVPPFPFPDDISGSTDDDAFMWWCDRMSNIWIECSIPIGLRVGLTSNIPDFIDAPIQQFEQEEFNSYLTEKFTVIDKDRGSGRLYRGYPTAEIYDANLDYMRFNKEKAYIHLPAEYDCCYNQNGDSETHPMRVHYSEQSFQEEQTDNYRAFLPNNYKDVEGQHGEITDMYTLSNNLYIQTKESLWHVPQNIQERVTNDIVSFIGTGDFFAIPPRKVVDDNLGSAGTQNKWATIKTRFGVLSVNELEGRIYLHGEGLKDIAEAGKMSNWFSTNLKLGLYEQLYNKVGVQFPNTDNPTSPYGIGFLSAFDARYKRILLTKRDYLLRDEFIDTLTVIDHVPTVIVDVAPLPLPVFYCSLNNRFYKYDITQAGGSYTHTPVMLSFYNRDYFENKGWTLSYYVERDSWISFHSYLPSYYIYNQSNLYTYRNDRGIFKHNRPDNFQTFYSTYCPFIVEYIAVANPITVRTFEDITLHTMAQKYDSANREWIDQKFVTFTDAIFYNSRQSTGPRQLIVKDNETPQDFMFNQVKGRVFGDILVTKKENIWHLNDLRDIRVDYNLPIFTTRWPALASSFGARLWIDKMPFLGSINYSKPWTMMEPLRDKYIVGRMIFERSDLSNIKLTFNYILGTELPSFR